MVKIKAFGAYRPKISSQNGKGATQFSDVGLRHNFNTHWPSND